VLTINSSKIKCFIACGNPQALNLIGIGGVPARLAPLQQALIYDMACGKSPTVKGQSSVELNMITLFTTLSLQKIFEVNAKAVDFRGGIP
jgi:hypothetical protein